MSRHIRENGLQKKDSELRACNRTCREQPIPNFFGRKQPKDSQKKWPISKRLPLRAASSLQYSVASPENLEVPIHTTPRGENFEQTLQGTASSETGSTREMGFLRREVEKSEFEPCRQASRLGSQKISFRRKSDVRVNTSSISWRMAGF